MYTLNDILERLEFPRQAAARGALIQGLVIQELATSQNFKHHRLSSVVESIRCSVEQNQIELLFDHTGKFAGYFCWAMVDAHVQDKMLSDPGFSLQHDDRRSGKHLWITDFYVSAGQLRKVLETMRDDIFPEIDQITYFRIKGRRRIAKRVASRTGHAFFSHRARNP